MTPVLWTAGYLGAGLVTAVLFWLQDDMEEPPAIWCYLFIVAFWPLCALVGTIAQVGRIQIEGRAAKQNRLAREAETRQKALEWEYNRLLRGDTVEDRRKRRWGE